MKKKLIILLIIIIACIGISVFIIYTKNSNEINNNSNNIEDYKELKNIEGKYTDLIIKDQETAKKSLETIKDELNIYSIQNELKDGTEDTSSDLVNTYKFEQIYNGIEVYNGEIIIYTDKDGKAEGVINKYNKLENELDTTPKIDNEKIESIIVNRIEGLGYKKYSIEKNSLIIYPNEKENYILAHKCEINTEYQKIVMIISDVSGEILSEDSSIYEAQKTKKTVLTQNDIDEYKISEKYELVDNSRNIKCMKFINENTEPELYVWNNLKEANNSDASIAIKTLKTIQKTYDYYDKVFGWKSLNGDKDLGLKVVTGVKNIDGNNYSNNAAFSPENMLLLGADNLFNEDVEVLTHEYTHGIFYFTVNLDTNVTYQNKIINEAYADIMGMCAEAYYNGNTNIDGVINRNNRKIKSSKVKFEDIPSSLKEYLRIKSKNRARDEHYYSVVISRAAYIMSEDLTLEELQKLWYNSIKLLPKDCTAYDCEYAILKIAKSMNLTEEKQKKIREAFYEVGIINYDLIAKDEEKLADRKWNVDENKIAGKWKAATTNSEIHSLGDLYGTSFSYANELNFNEDGTYELAIGVTYWQDGNYEVDGDTIKLTNTKYKGDNPDNKIVDSFTINDEGIQKKIIMKEKSWEDNTIVDVIFTLNGEILESKTDNKQDNTIDIKVGNHILKTGTYKSTLGSSATVSGTFILNYNKTCTYNGVALKGGYGSDDWDVTGTYSITKEDLYGFGELSNCIQFSFSNGETCSFEVLKDNEFSSDWIGFRYSKN